MKMEKVKSFLEVLVECNPEQFPEVAELLKRETGYSISDALNDLKLDKTVFLTDEELAKVRSGLEKMGCVLKVGLGDSGDDF